MKPTDRLGRPLTNLRISVTDRCNLRCRYCMPEEEYVWLPREEILQFEEISALVDAFATLGVQKVRLTGGEPLLRRDLPALVALLAKKEAISDLALTTNGIFLAREARRLKEAGLGRLTVSLDTLSPERFLALTRRDALKEALHGIEAACQAGFSGLKINTVVIRGVNDDELVPLIEYGKSMRAEVRFIEYMDVGGATRWSSKKVFGQKEILARVEAHYGAPKPLPGRASAPAERFALPDGTRFGIISSTTAPFCSACDRSRLTADGLWYLCLYGREGLDVRGALRGGASLVELASLIRGAWEARADRGAEERLALAERGPLAPSGELREDPHLEMHTRGG